MKINNKFIVIVNSILWLLSFTGMIWLAFINETDFRIKLFNDCNTTFLICMGIFIGMFIKQKE